MLRDAILAVVQGLTEFLPVSSSGHLVLIGHWLGGKDTALDGAGPVFEVIVHLGTLLAVIVFLRSQLLHLVCQAAGREGGAGRRAAGRVLATVAVATVPIGVVGLTFKDRIQSAFGDPVAAACLLLVTGAVLALTRRVEVDPRREDGARLRLEGILLWQAAAIGVAQAAAILPGLSRSGLTIGVALLLGVQRVDAGRFSFLLAIPAICGAAVVQLGDCDPALFLTARMAVSFLVAFGVGLASLALLKAMLVMRSFHLFAYYLVPAGAIALLYELVWA